MPPWLTIWIARFASSERFRKATSHDYRLWAGFAFFHSGLFWPIYGIRQAIHGQNKRRCDLVCVDSRWGCSRFRILPLGDRKSTRLNSSHLVISYAVFCLKKKKKYI